MAASDQTKVSSRSSDRGLEEQRQRANDAVAGVPARVLALQRTLGNRATSQLLRSWHSGGRLLQRQLRDMPGVVSGWQIAPLDEQTGRKILGEFSRNDPISVPMLVNVPAEVTDEGMPGDKWGLDDQEWGLIRENGTGEVHLIKGGEHGVKWGPYVAHGTPLAHSHPWQAGGRSSRLTPTRVEKVAHSTKATLRATRAR